MEMEVLLVQNHNIQKQFGVIGSKKDWTSSLTPPSARIILSPTNMETTDITQSASMASVYNSLHSKKEHFDVVDGLNSHHNSAFIPQSTTGQAHPQLQHGYSFIMDTATISSASPKSSIDKSSSTFYTYNNNLLYCSPNTTSIHTSTSCTTESSNRTPYHSHYNDIPDAALTPSPVSSNLSTPTEATEHFGTTPDNDIDSDTLNELSQRLQAELRAAKIRHLSCAEVSLPWDLTPRIAADIIKTSEREPCGVRGCTIFIDFKDETGSARRIASFKVDPNTVSTFELFLTLKQDKGGWTSLLPQFLRNLTRSSTIISPHFILNKHKLYACE